MPVVVVLLATVVGFFIYKQTFSTPVTVTTEGSVNPTNIRASFAVFTNGTFRTFSDSKYHNLSPAVYIKSQNPNVVTVEIGGVVWGDFFETLPMKLDSSCLTTGTGQKFCSGSSGTLKFYINGSLDQNALSRKIEDGDKLLVSFGSESESEIEAQFSQIP